MSYRSASITPGTAAGTSSAGTDPTIAAGAFPNSKRRCQSDGHYGTVAANDGLRQIAADYRNTAFPNGQTDALKLNYNDQSLVRGAKFDIQAPATWAAISFDENSNTATGYASTELDYETAYYYDAEVQAHIEDEDGNVLGSGQATGNPSAETFFDVVQIVFCFRISIVSYVIVAPHFLGCNGRYFDIFGFSDFWFGWWWDFGDFGFYRRTRCIFGRLITIAAIIRDIIRCLPVDVSCSKVPDTNQLLPGGLSNRDERPYLVGLVAQVNDSDHVTIACRATREITGQPQSGVTVRFGFGDPPSGGGHVQHQGVRPQGSWSSTVVRTGSDGWASSVYTAPIFGGTTQILMTVDGDEVGRANMETQVPSLNRLQNPTNTEGYLLIGNTATHPDSEAGRFSSGARRQAHRAVDSSRLNYAARSQSQESNP